MITPFRMNGDGRGEALFRPNTGLPACLLLSLAWHLLSVPQAVCAFESTPLSIEDALRVRYFADFERIAASPTGEWLAYTVRRNEQTQSFAEAYYRTGVPPTAFGTDIYLRNTKTGETTMLTDGTSNNWGASWSPDGRSLAFLSDRNGGEARVWLWDVARETLRKVSDADVRMFQADVIEWTPDGRSIMVPVVPQGMALEEYARIIGFVENDEDGKSKKPETRTVSLYKSAATGEADAHVKSDPWDLRSRTRGVLKIEIADGKGDFVVPSEALERIKISPDGSRLAFTVPVRFERAGSQQTLFNLVVLNLATRKETRVASEIRLNYDGAEFSWSPDSRHLAFQSGGVAEKDPNCYFVDAEGKRLEKLDVFSSEKASPQKSSFPVWDLSDQFYFVRNGTLWRGSSMDAKGVEVASIDGRRITRIVAYPNDILWTTDGSDSTVVATHDDRTQRDGFYKVNLATGESRELLEDGACYSCANTEWQVTPTADGKHVLYFREDAGNAPDIWINTPEFEHAQRLTNLNPQLDKYNLRAARLVDWLSDDGQRLHGALLLPSGYQEGKRYPLVVWVYGGDLVSRHWNEFGLAGTGPFNMQLLATRGYAVLLPDAPYHPGTEMIDLGKTVLPGVNKVIEMGIVDSTRLGVMGQSNGGYSVLSLLVDSPRFGAAIDIDGMGDLIGMYGEMDDRGSTYGISVEHGQDAMGGTPWQAREKYIENSPIFYLDRVATPLMVVHGAKDLVVAPFLGDEVFVGLRRLGREVEYAKYWGEGHSPLYWSYANQTDLTMRILDWFDRKIGPSSAGVTSRSSDPVAPVRAQ